MNKSTSSRPKGRTTLPTDTKTYRSRITWRLRLLLAGQNRDGWSPLKSSGPYLTKSPRTRGRNNSRRFPIAIRIANGNQPEQYNYRGVKKLYEDYAMEWTRRAILQCAIRRSWAIHQSASYHSPISQRAISGSQFRERRRGDREWEWDWDCGVTNPQENLWQEMHSAVANQRTEGQWMMCSEILRSILSVLLEVGRTDWKSLVIQF